MQNSMVVLTFWAKLVKKNKIVSLSQNLAKIWLKNETLSYMQNSMVMFTFPVLNRKYPLRPS